MNDAGKRVHVVIPRPDATPEQLRQLAAAKELVEVYLSEAVLDPDEEHSFSMAAHFAHEFLWTHAGGATAQWCDFPVEHYFLEIVPGTGLIPPPLAEKLMEETLTFFSWLGRSKRMDPLDAEVLRVRADACRAEMLAAAGASWIGRAKARLN